MKTLLSLLCLFLFLNPLEAAKRPAEKERPPRLSSVQIIDRNGFSETIAGKERLENFEKVNFFNPQPYQRVLRQYQPDRDGATYSFLTTYYENGQVKQFLEIKNARAFGRYEEWFSHGGLKIKTQVIGGLADVTPVAQGQWQFDGDSLAYDEEGHLIAKIPYEKGVLEGVSETYSSSGSLLTKTPYKNGLIEGEVLIYSPDKTLLEKHTFKEGLLDGSSETFWVGGNKGTVETYKKGQLTEGSSFDRDGNLLLSVSEGEGERLYISEGKLKEKQEIHDGELRGAVTAYEKDGKIAEIYHIRLGEKHGPETLFFPNGKKKIEIEWVEGKIQGRVTTWYTSGIKESERELVKNQKQGIALAWYPNGDFMLIESYDNDLLEKGEYYKKGEKSPISRVVDGKGIVTVYDKDGLLLQKVPYENGKPAP